MLQHMKVQPAWIKDYGLGLPVEGEAWFNHNVPNRLNVVRMKTVKKFQFSVQELLMTLL